MKILYIGNFSQRHCTEVHIAATLEALGHEVVRLQENELSQDWVLDRPDGVDLVLYTRTWGQYVTMLDLADLKRPQIPTASYHLDLYHGIRRQAGVENDPFWFTDYVFTPDGSPEAAEFFVSKRDQSSLHPAECFQSRVCAGNLPTRRLFTWRGWVKPAVRGPRRNNDNGPAQRTSARFRRLSSSSASVPERPPAYRVAAACDPHPSSSGMAFFVRLGVSWAASRLPAHPGTGRCRRPPRTPGRWHTAAGQRRATGHCRGQRPPGLILDLAEQFHGEPVSATRSLVSLRARRLPARRGTTVRPARSAQVTAAVDEFRIYGITADSSSRHDVSHTDEKRSLNVNRAAEFRNESPTRAARVDPVGTRRRLQALACLGWDMVQLGELSNVPVDRLRAIANDAAPQRGISSHTASAVARTYAALSAKPPSSRPSLGRSAERRATLRRTWKRAAAAGWLPPMSWTPDTIDEPTADPLPIDAAAALAELIPMIVYNGWAARLSSPHT